jgi:hypothetical protein
VRGGPQRERQRFALSDIMRKETPMYIGLGTLVIIILIVLLILFLRR